jgi:hypothetical protein
LLPLDLLFIQTGELRDSQAGFEQSIDTKFFLQRVSDGKKSVSFFDGKWFAFVLVGDSLKINF